MTQLLNLVRTVWQAINIDKVSTIVGGINAIAVWIYGYYVQHQPVFAALGALVMAMQGAANGAGLKQDPPAEEE